jgi:hypothetical protein
MVAACTLLILLDNIAVMIMIRFRQANAAHVQHLRVSLPDMPIVASTQCTLQSVHYNS